MKLKLFLTFTFLLVLFSCKKQEVIQSNSTNRYKSADFEFIGIEHNKLLDETFNYLSDNINSLTSLKEVNEFLSTKKKFIEIVDEFLDFIEGKRLVIHNAEFDLGHLNNELKLIGKEKIKNDTVDTLSLAREKFPGSSISLDALCKRYRIDNSKRTQHTALIDCDLLAKVYINLIDQKEPTLNFQNQDEVNKEKAAFNVAYFKKVIKPSLEELKKHKEYLKTNLKKNYFN